MVAIVTLVRILARIEIFRFKDEKDYEYTRFDSREKFVLPFFTRKVSTVIFSEGGYALSRSQNDKTDNSFSPLQHGKIRSGVTTATTFSRHNDVGSRASTT